MFAGLIRPTQIVVLSFFACCLFHELGGLNAGQFSLKLENEAFADGTKAIFAEPLVPKVDHVTEFIGRDQERVRAMNFAPSAVSSRLARIKSMSEQFQAQKGKSTEALKIGNELLNVHIEQALYLENLRGIGMTDRRYPDLEHFIRVARRSAIDLADRLQKDYPTSPLASSWKIVSLESRMRVGDNGVFKDAGAFVSENKGSRDAARLQALGVALTHTGKLQGKYGTLTAAITLDLDVHSKAALKLLVAESLVKSNPTEAIRFFREAAKEGLSIRRPDGAEGPVTGRASSRLLAEALARKPDRPNQEVVEFLQSMGLQNHLKFYIEKCALNNLPKDIPGAVDGYDALLKFAKLSEAENVLVEKQSLELAVASGSTDLIEERWKRFGQFNSEANKNEISELIGRTQNIFWGQFKKTSTPQMAERFVRMHDFLRQFSQKYAADEQWQIRAIEALFSSSNYDEASSRADVLAKGTKNKETKIAALRYSSRAKEKLLDISVEPVFSDNPKLKAGGKMVSTYIDINEVLAALVSGIEAERSAYYAAFLTFQIESPVKGKKDYMAVTARFPNSKYAPGASFYALDTSIGLKDYEFVEAFARHLEKLRIAIQDKRYTNLRSVIEIAVYEQALKFQEDKKHTDAADKFVAFQNEFPKSSKADMALHLASRNYTAASQAEKSVGEMEKLLKLYPKSSLAKETRWSAAEQSRSMGQLLRAANHYAEFATQHPKEGRERKAWLTAAELQKGLGRFSHAIAMYEKYLATAASKAEKVTAAREMAMLQHKYGSPQDALASYDRVLKVSGDAKDEAWSRYNTVEILLRQGMEREARGEATKLAALQVEDQESRGYQAKIRYKMGKMESSRLTKVELNLQKELLAAAQKLVADYASVKKELMAPCEVPGHDHCSVGYFEVAKLAESLAGLLLEVAPPPTIDPAIAAKVNNFSKTEADRLVAESLAYAQQAEAALSQGAPDSETADLIRGYSQRASGRDFSEVPD